MIILQMKTGPGGHFGSIQQDLTRQELEELAFSVIHLIANRMGEEPDVLLDAVRLSTINREFDDFISRNPIVTS